MGKVIYVMNSSIDGFVETTDGRHDWGFVDEELHDWFNEQSRPLAGEFYGRRLWEVMSSYWPHVGNDPSAKPTELEFARLWNATPKFVFSNSLSKIEHNGRLVRGDVGEVLRAVRREIDGDLGVAGPDLAGQFIRQGLVDEFRMVVHPVVLGSGKPFWPKLDAPLRLQQTGSRKFKSGVEARFYVPVR